jgi:hypothetical protein
VVGKEERRLWVGSTERDRGGADDGQRVVRTTAVGAAIVQDLDEGE